MADKEKKNAAAPSIVPEAKPVSVPKSMSSKSKRARKRLGSSMFALFPQRKMYELRAGFEFMDDDQDGVIDKNDLRNTFLKLGEMPKDKEVNDMVDEVDGPLNFTQLLGMFTSHAPGECDEDEDVIAAFKFFDEGGVIDSEKLKTDLMSYGDKFTEKEINACFGGFKMDAKKMIRTEEILDAVIGQPTKGPKKKEKKVRRY